MLRERLPEGDGLRLLSVRAGGIGAQAILGFLPGATAIITVSRVRVDRSAAGRSIVPLSAPIAFPLQDPGPQIRALIEVLLGALGELARRP